MICPKCGSTDISMVKNKILCRNCCIILSRKKNDEYKFDNYDEGYEGLDLNEFVGAYDYNKMQDLDEDIDLFFAEKPFIKTALPIINRKDIFTIKIPDKDLLWRVRAYVIGFLLADGTIRTKPYELAVAQNSKDRDILYNINKGLGGKISGPDDDDKYYLNVYNKNLVLKLIEYGMVKAHSKRFVAESLLSPDFITKRVNGQTLIRDFIRGFYEGDGWITGSYVRGDTSFRILGPLKFLNALKDLIAPEIPEISSFMTSEKKQYYIRGDKRYSIFSKLRIYKKGYGFYKLTPIDLEKGEIKVLEHPWLKILHFAGNFNCIRFFNWMYENNDNFDSFEIEGIKICGKRKFIKALSILGDEKHRKEKLAPNWKDVLPDIIPLLGPRFYRAKEIMALTNNKLQKKLESLELDYLFESQKATNLDKFRNRLKYIEFLDNLIGHYRELHYKHYYSKIYPPSKIPPQFKRIIDLVDKNGIKKNIKNLIIYIFILENRSINFNELVNKLKSSLVFSKNSLFLKNIKLNLMELVSFEFLVIDDSHKVIEDQVFVLNASTLYNYFRKNLNQIKYNLQTIFPNLK